MWYEWGMLIGGVDWTDVERLCGDKDGWMHCLKERVRHVDKCDVFRWPGLTLSEAKGWQF